MTVSVTIQSEAALHLIFLLLLSLHSSMLQLQWHSILRCLTFWIMIVSVRKVLVPQQALPHAPPLPPPHPNTISLTMIAFVNIAQAHPGLHLLPTAPLASQAGALPSFHTQKAAAATVTPHPLAAHHKRKLQVSNLQPAAKAQAEKEICHFWFLFLFWYRHRVFHLLLIVFLF